MRETRPGGSPPPPPATYLLHFGENYRHFHVDPAAAVALVPGVRATYEKAISRTNSGTAISEAPNAQLS